MSAEAPLYQRVLGEVWERLPGPVRRLHDLHDSLRAEGLADIDRGRSLAARTVAEVMGFPPAGRAVPVTVEFTRTARGEVWRRTFAGRSLHSRQWQGVGRDAGLVFERLGPAAFGLHLTLEDGRLKMAVRRWRLFGVPLPAAWAPAGDSFETAEDGRFRFHIEIRHPLTGLIVRYRGWLAHAEAA